MAPTPGDDHSKAKVALEWIFAASAAFAILLALTARYLHLRKRGANRVGFFTFGEASIQPPTTSRGPTMSPIRLPPIAHISHSQVRGLETDSQGRRAGGGDLDDGDFDEKDLLPAYDNLGRPPGYPARPPAYVQDSL